VSSPRTRGCFSSRVNVPSSSGVFPAHAGVFLAVCPFKEWKNSLPRARGGVSIQWVQGKLQVKSSPRTRGCFQITMYTGIDSKVFPAHAGVFLYLHYQENGGDGLPRARGGVSSKRRL
jgi:hypothetical protein